MFSRMYHYRDIKLIAAPGVYPPSDDSLLLAESVQPRGRVLEIGTGSGVVAIHLAKQGHKVVATDINPEAIANARENSRLNGVEDRVEVVRTDLMDGIKGPFDTVVFNPPYLPSRPLGELRGIGELGAAMGLPGPGLGGEGLGHLREFSPNAPIKTWEESEEKGPDGEEEPEEPDDWLSRSWQGGEDGAEVMERFVGELSGRLATGGRGYIVTSSLTNFKLPDESDLDFRVVAERSFPFERIFVLEVFKRSGEGN